MKNGKVALKFKDEFGAKLIYDICGLKRKTYSIIAEGVLAVYFDAERATDQPKLVSGSTKKPAKGVTLEAQKELTHERYKSIIVSGSAERLENMKISSRQHWFETTSTKKISLCS